MGPVLEIFKMAGYFLDSPHMCCHVSQDMFFIFLAMRKSSVNIPQSLKFISVSGFMNIIVIFM